MVKHRSNGPSIAIVALVWMAIVAQAQNPPVPEKPDTQSEPTWLFGSIESGEASQPDPDAGLLKLDVVVIDQHDKSVSGLGENDLTLQDNGQSRRIITFQATRGTASTLDARTEIILVIDEIDTPADDLPAVKQTAQKFLEQNGGHLSHPVMIYRITSEGLFASTTPSLGGNALAAELNQNNGPRMIWKSQDLSRRFDRNNSSNLNDSGSAAPLQSEWHELPHSLIALGSIAIEERRWTGRKLLFWLGNPWNFRPSRWHHLFDAVTELSTRMREARITLWFDALLLDGDFTDQNYRNLDFQVLAVQTGGGVLRGDSDAAGHIGQSVADANAFYTITFDPERGDTIDAHHDLKVEVDKPGLTVHTRTEYYDQPAYFDQASSDIEHVTVAQFTNAVDELRNSSDSKAAQRMKHMQLIERLSSDDLGKLLKTVKGNNAREALIAVADESAFLPPPAQDVPKQPLPSFAEAQQIVQHMIDYVNKTVPVLPDLIADRTTTLYLEGTRAPGQTW